MRFMQGRMIKNPTRRITTLAAENSYSKLHKFLDEYLDGPPTRSPIPSCRAVSLRQFGGPEVLELRDDVKIADLRSFEVLVRTRAVSINPIDIAMRSGYIEKTLIPSFPSIPLILGRDISGEIVAVGAAVKKLTVGQEVFGALHPTVSWGTYADYAIFAEYELSPKPKSISHEEASAIPFAALTAWAAFNRKAAISEGHRVLVIGGGRCVGFAAIQLAVAKGCQVVTTCGRKSFDRVLAAGVEQAVEYKTEVITVAEQDMAIKGDFDVVLDTIGGAKAERLATSLLKHGGEYTTLQGGARSMIADYFGTNNLSEEHERNFFYYSYYFGIRYSHTFMEPDYSGLAQICRLSEAGKFYIPVAGIFPFTRVREAHEAKEKRQILGKVVLKFD